MATRALISRTPLRLPDGILHARTASAPNAMAGLGETFDTGRDTNVPITKDYSDGGDFTGTITRSK